MKAVGEVLSVVRSLRGNRTGPGPVQGAMAWQILGRLERVDIGGPLEPTVLNDLLTRADQEVMPVLKQLADDRVIVLNDRAVF